MTEKRRRLALDGLLTVLLIFEMFYQLTGNTLHEVAGIVFFVAIVTHLILSRKWIAAASRAVGARKRIKGATVARMAINCALALVIVALLVSSIAISNLLLRLNINLSGGAYSTWAMVHTACSYALCGLTVIHLALHWTTMAAAFKIPYDPGRRTAINTGVAAVAMLGIIGLELTGANALAKLVSPAEGGAQGDGNAETTTREQPAWDKGNRSGNKSSDIPSTPKGELGSSDSIGERSGSNEGASENADGNGSGTTTSGICTLCGKRCPLNNPRCNRPYQSGLI